MRPSWWLKISFEKREPKYQGLLKGGWIAIPPNKEVDLNIWLYGYIKWPMCVYLSFISILRVIYCISKQMVLRNNNEGNR